MCLAVPGRISHIMGDDPLSRMAKVNFGGIAKDICLAYVPDARVGEYVLVHAGFALETIDDAEAQIVFDYLSTMGELDEIDGSAR